jgi:hypothetical protein
MSLPNFTAESSMYASHAQYRQSSSAASGAAGVIPAIPACANCDWILDRCEQNGWRPRALCAACAVGNCYEEPPVPDPFGDPFFPFPRFPRL